MAAESISIDVRLFGGLAELAGQRSVRVEVSAPATARSIRDAVVTAVPQLDGALRGCKVAVDLEIAVDTTPVSSDTEVALLPPVAGGSHNAPTWHASELTINGRTVLTVTGLVEPPIATEAILTQISTPSAGAAVSFLGTVRNHAEDLDDVVGLEYSAYPAMAERQLAVIAAQIAQCHEAVTGIALIHAVGDLRVGDHTILVACASAHRAEAFAACQQALEDVKNRVPIWKRERTADGNSRWVGLPATVSPD